MRQPRMSEKGILDGYLKFVHGTGYAFAKGYPFARGPPGATDATYYPQRDLVRRSPKRRRQKIRNWVPMSAPFRAPRPAEVDPYYDVHPGHEGDPNKPAKRPLFTHPSWFHRDRKKPLTHTYDNALAWGFFPQFHRSPSIFSPDIHFPGVQFMDATRYGQGHYPYFPDKDSRPPRRDGQIYVAGLVNGQRGYAPATFPLTIAEYVPPPMDPMSMHVSNQRWHDSFFRMREKRSDTDTGAGNKNTEQAGAAGKSEVPIAPRAVSPSAGGDAEGVEENSANTESKPAGQAEEEKRREENEKLAETAIAPPKPGLGEAPSPAANLAEYKELEEEREAEKEAEAVQGDAQTAAPAVEGESGSPAPDQAQPQDQPQDQPQPQPQDQPQAASGPQDQQQNLSRPQQQRERSKEREGEEEGENASMKPIGYADNYPPLEDRNLPKLGFHPHQLREYWNAFTAGPPDGINRQLSPSFLYHHFGAPPQETSVNPYPNLLQLPTGAYLNPVRRVTLNYDPAKDDPLRYRSDPYRLVKLVANGALGLRPDTAMPRMPAMPTGDKPDEEKKAAEAMEEVTGNSAFTPPEHGPPQPADADTEEAAKAMAAEATSTEPGLEAPGEEKKL